MTKELIFNAKGLSKRTLAKKAKRAAADIRMARAMADLCKPQEEAEFIHDELYGLPVRAKSGNAEEAKSFLRGRRAFGMREVLEELGYGHAAEFVRKGWVVFNEPVKGLKPVKGSQFTRCTMFLITKKCAEELNLPKVLPNGCPGAYIDPVKYYGKAA